MLVIMGAQKPAFQPLMTHMSETAVMVKTAETEMSKASLRSLCSVASGTGTALGARVA